MPWGDRSILNEIIGQSRDLDPHLARLFRRAAVQTGLVESGGRNLAGGDADSQGWRQERTSIYGTGRNGPRNVQASVARFKQEFLQHYSPGEKAWQVAADVQRPAAQFRGRYHDVAREANQILHSAMSGQGGAQAAGGQGGDGGSTQGAGNQPQGSEGLLPLLAALSESKQAPSSAGLQAPAFSAQAAMPAGAAVPSSSGGPQPKQDPAALLDAIRTVGGDVQHAPGLSGGDGSTGGNVAGTGGTGQLGRVIVAPGANRPGVPLQRDVRHFIRQVAGLYGAPLTIGTGTNHSRNTVNGTESDHWRGEGADVPLTGRSLIKAGQDALIAAGMSPKKARKQTGGGFNVGGWQVIFNTNAPGWGDHTTHLHVGRRRG